MAQGDEPVQLQLGPENREEALSFVANEMQRQISRVSIGLPEAEPVVGNHLMPRGLTEPLWKVSPQLDASKGVMKEHDRRLYPAARHVQRQPASRKQAPVRCIDPDCLGIDERWH
ncbi:hypothetical protein D3C78_819360 [compost metagenome]